MWFGMVRVISLSFFLVLLVHSSHGQTATDAINLRQHLFVTNSYDKRIRPSTKQYNATRIYVNFHLLALNEVNAEQETLRLTAYLQLKWVDDFLTWAPKNFGYLMSYHWPQDEVWKPVIALRNSYLDYKALGDETLDVTNYYDGTIVWMPFQVFTSTCSMDVMYYPFDKQTCHVKFVAWGYIGSEVAMVGGDKGIVLDEYESNPQWELLHTSWEVQYSDTDVTIAFTMIMKRVPSYVIFTVILPVLLLTILNIFVFILPCESGERVGYAVTVFLSFAVFFTLISDVLPESVALFTIYVITMTAQSAIICLIAILQVRLSVKDDGDDPVPSWLKCVSNTRNCKWLKRKIAARKTTPVEKFNRTKKVQTRREMGPGVADESDDALEEEYTWKNTISALDYVFAVLFTSASIIVTAACIGISANAE